MESIHLSTPPEAPLPLDVQLLGGFSVSVGPSRLPEGRWPSRRAAHLVQLLALQPRFRLTRDEAIDALWPQLDPAAGAANLRKAMHHARQALGRHDAIVGLGDELVLWPDRPVHVDALAFEQRADLALSRRDAADCADVACAYTGDLLPGARYDVWTETARERLHARFVALLRASAQWDRLAQLEPTDEPAHRALMQFQLQAGNRAAALRWYAHLREALQQELGVAPDPETESLYERCLEGMQPAAPAFVGRAQALAQAMAWLGLPTAERPGGIVLRGPGGIGKSAFCVELAAQLRSRDWTVLRVELAGSGRAYGMATALVERLLLSDRALLDRIGASARNVLALLTPLAGPAEPLSGPLGRHQVVGALRRLLVAAAGDGYLLLQVDDAHLAEAADVDVLLQLVMAGAPVCTMLAIRPPAAGAALARGIARLERAGALNVMQIEPLDDDECRRLIQRTAATPLAEAVIAGVLAAAQGNPFSAIELAHCAASSGDRRLPASTTEAVLERLCDVPDGAQALLKWLAVCGDPLDTETVETMARVAQLAGLASLDACLTEGVLVLSGVHYRFRHDIVRQALVDQIPPHQRVRMHREIAERLAEQEAPPAGIAHHLLAAGRARQAVPWLLAAARDAVRLAAFHDALGLLDPLIDVAPDHAEALRLRADSLDALGEPAALAAYRRAADVATPAAAHDLLAKAALAQVKQGDPAGALVLLEGLRPTSIEGRLCEALAFSGAAALGAADPAIGTAKAAAARRLALQSGDTASIVVASWAQAAAAHARGELHQSVWADLQETSTVPHLALRVFDGHLCITQRFLYGARPYAEVIAFADALSVEARRLGAARGEAFGTTLRGEAEWLAGDLPAARLHLREGARLHRAVGGAVGEALSLQRLAELSLHEGNQVEARSLVDEALDLARQTDIGFHLLDRIYGTRIALHADDPQEALHVLHDAAESVRGPLETCPGCRITFAVPAAIAAARAGEVELAERHATQCTYLANVVMRLPAWHAALDEVHGHVAAARDAAPDETARHFAAATARYRGAGQPIDAARCERSAAIFTASRILPSGNG